MEIRKIFDSDFFRDMEIKGISFNEEVIADKEFYKCSFKNNNLSRTTFQNCRFEDCEFENCDLSLTKLNGSEFINIKFNNAKLIGINWTDAKNLNRIEFHQCKLNHSTFFGMNLRQIIIKDCEAIDVDFTDAILNKANCRMTDFKGSKFSNTDLSYANFFAAKNYDIDPTYNKIMKATFSIPEVLTLLQGFDIVVK